MSTVENEFHQEMLDIYTKAKKDCKYNAIRFLEMVHTMGGLNAAKQLLSKDAPQYGFTKLWECGRLDLSVEALVLKEQFRHLFTQEEQQVARIRLQQYGYIPK